MLKNDMNLYFVSINNQKNVKHIYFHTEVSCQPLDLFIYRTSLIFI